MIHEILIYMVASVPYIWAYIATVNAGSVHAVSCTARSVFCECENAIQGISLNLCGRRRTRSVCEVDRGKDRANVERVVCMVR